MKDKELIVNISRTAYMRGLTAGSGGNVSVRTPDNTVLITPHKKSLAFLTIDDILTVDLKGNLINGTGQVSTELDMHLALYRAYDVNAVIHLHPPCINSLADKGVPITFTTIESKLILGGSPPVLEQKTPIVTDMEPLVAAFKRSRLVCLKNHGTVSAGEDLYGAYGLTDVAEEAARMTINAMIIGNSAVMDTDEEAGAVDEKGSDKLPVFSEEHMAKVQRLVNEDNEAQTLGQETDLTMKYAIVQEEDGKTFNMHFEKGKIVQITTDDDTDFINIGKKETWIDVFNGRLDPFTATYHNELRLVKGHIRDLGKWYRPFYRIFALWKDAPVLELDEG